MPLKMALFVLNWPPAVFSALFAAAVASSALLTPANPALAFTTGLAAYELLLLWLLAVVTALNSAMKARPRSRDLVIVPLVWIASVGVVGLPLIQFDATQGLHSIISDALLVVVASCVFISLLRAGRLFVLWQGIPPQKILGSSVFMGIALFFSPIFLWGLRNQIAELVADANAGGDRR